MPLGVFLISFGVYVYTVSPYIVPGDSTEMTVAILTLGVPHQPSYPVYVTVSHLVSQLIRWGRLPWRANMTASLYHSLALVFLFWFVRDTFLKPQESSRLKILALAAGILWTGFSRIYWEYSTFAEVGSFMTLLVSILLWTGNKYLIGEKANSRYLYLTAGIYGLALAHHQIVIFLILPLLTALFLYRKFGGKDVLSVMRLLGNYLTGQKVPDEVKAAISQSNLRTVFLSTLAFGLGLATYGLLLLLAARQPGLNWGYPRSLSDLAAAFTRQDFGGAISPALLERAIPAGWRAHLAFFADMLPVDMTYWFLGLAVFGIVSGLYKIRRAMTVLLLMFLFSGPVFFAVSRYPMSGEFSLSTIRKFYILPEMFLGLIGVYGLLTIVTWFSERINADIRKTRQQLARLSLAIILIASVGVPIYFQFNAVNRHAFSLSEDILSSSLSEVPDKAIVMPVGDIMGMGIDYKAIVGEERKERVIFSPGQLHLKWKREELYRQYGELLVPPPKLGNRFTVASQVIAANIDKQRIFISPELVELDPHISEDFDLDTNGLLFEVFPKNKAPQTDVAAVKSRVERAWQGIKLWQLDELYAKYPAFDAEMRFYLTRFFHNSGLTLKQEKQVDEAAESFRHAVRIDPGFAPSYVALADTLLIRSTEADKEEAARMYERALQFPQDQAEAERILKKLEELTGKRGADFEAPPAVPASKSATPSSVSPPTPAYGYAVVGGSMAGRLPHASKFLSLGDKIFLSRNSIGMEF